MKRLILNLLISISMISLTLSCSTTTPAKRVAPSNSMLISYDFNCDTLDFLHICVPILELSNQEIDTLWIRIEDIKSKQFEKRRQRKRNLRRI